MTAPFQPRNSSPDFALTGMTLTLIILILIPSFGDAQIPRCALVESFTGKEIDVKNGFETSEFDSLSIKVVVVGGKGEYRVDNVETTLARGKNAIATTNSFHSPYVTAPSFFKAGDRMVVKVVAIFLKKPDGTEERVTVNNMQFVIPIH